MYDQINPDGSITRMPGTYHIKEARAKIKSINEHNEKLRKSIEKKQAEDLAERSEMVSSWFRHLNNHGSSSLEKFLGLKDEN